MKYNAVRFAPGLPVSFASYIYILVIHGITKMTFNIVDSVI